VKVARRKWRGIFDRSNKFVGIIEQVGAKWHAFAAGGVFVGITESAEEAAQLIERERSGGPDESHR
jgi:hypothetical protein